MNFSSLGNGSLSRWVITPRPYADFFSNTTAMVSWHLFKNGKLTFVHLHLCEDNPFEYDGDFLCYRVWYPGFLNIACNFRTHLEVISCLIGMLSLHQNGKFYLETREKIICPISLYTYLLYHS
jgi:hypothetical protein